MKRLLLLLMMLGCLSQVMMAEGEYPNALMVRLNSGSTLGFQLEGTTLRLHSSANQVKISTLEDNQTFTLSDVKSITYEYHDLSTLGIDMISMKGMADIEVYTLNGHKIMVERTSFGMALNGLSNGVYIIKVNGRTLKIAK